MPSISLGTKPDVDRGRIGVIGVCGSGGFALAAHHVDLYDRMDLIPWDRLQSFFRMHLA